MFSLSIFGNVRRPALVSAWLGEALISVLLNTMAPDTSIRALESRDFMEMERELGAWDHQYRQVSSGAFRGRLLLTQTDSLGIFRNRWERAIHYQGVAPKGTVGLAITLSQPGEARWMGQPVTADDVIVQPCGVEAEYISASLWDSVVFTIPEIDFLQQTADITHADPVEILRRPSVVHLTTQVAAQTREACAAYLGIAEQSLANPDAPSPLAEMAKSAAELITRAVASSLPPRDRKPSWSRHRQLIDKAVDYCEYREDEAIRISELCRELGVSERTLRFAFQSLTGMPPLAFLKRQRLNRIYRILRNSDPAEMLVKQVAYPHGFSHLGQFSRDYRQLFGEAPSETLRRR
jgi:AraC family ethanolamine operon transcriptional activator